MRRLEDYMKKEKTSIRNKEIITLVLIILIFILIRFALLYIGAMSVCVRMLPDGVIVS